MKKETIDKIQNTPYIKQFLIEESHHFKYLFRDDNYLKTIEQLAKEKYHLRLEDKIESMKDNLTLINTFIRFMK